MSKLQIKYSKEIAKELGKIAVYLPGEHLTTGDIITFPNGKSMFSKPKPFGTFKKITSLKKLGVNYDEPKFSKTPDTYHFSSKNTVKFTSEINGNVDLGNDNLPGGEGGVNIEFSSEGAIYFLAIDCDKKELNDLLSLENEINSRGKKMLWEDTYLVTSVTVAKKALIIQSRSKSSNLIIEGNVKGIQSGNVEMALQPKLNFKKQNGDIFIKDWSNDVTVFMDVVKFKKEVFESEKYERSIENIKFNEEDKIKFEQIKIEELLID
ncbi:hypothetical protein Q4Q35_03525 [Flavivirga aquimarina]|uniref:Uncharacterized protein n=1 Tax=Flavivirga aquimarina TaxID=2027862 RepID=A0ABT8W6X3_9FLAO|nr:hypothetical protein [Flavivirga aquimarina]MDO5968867.1 hypothetical protein [Flavivirga aquimarina]